MDPERERIQADLKGLLDGEIRCDDAFVSLYASDASIYQIKPLGVIRPRGVGDVVAAVKYAAETGVSLHARGAGSSIAGQSLGAGLVLDFSHSMRRLLDFDEETVRIQPGIVLANLNRTLQREGKFFAPDPSTRSVSTMGGVLSLNASGSHFLKYGCARDHIVSMQLVLADGSVVEANRHSVASTATDSKPTRGEIVRRVGDLLTRRADVIEKHRPQTLVNASGYLVHDCLNQGQLDLAKMLVGSEGTLALMTEATVKIMRRPEHRGVALVFFDRLESAAQGALEAREFDLAACDLMDRRLLTIGRETDPAYDALIPNGAEALLLVELQGESESEVRSRLNQLVVRLQRRKRLAFDAIVTMQEDERNRYWRLARRVVPRLYRLRGSNRSLPFVEGIAIPPEALPDFFVRAQNVFKSNHVTASVFAHAAHGQLHIRPFLDMTQESELKKLQQLAIDLYAEVDRVGGVLSGEHGDGLSRTWFGRKHFGEMYSVFREVKRIFDPQNIFNPGKVVADAPQPPTKNLRPLQAVTADKVDDDKEVNHPPAQPFEPLLIWNNGEFTYENRNCNGCGRCRTQSLDERMCPVFRALPAEEASPRAKANIMRAVLTGELSPDALAGEPLKEIADLCHHCHQCRLECPAKVDIPKLMVEAKSQFVARNGLLGSDWFFSRLGFFTQLASRFSSLTNWGMSNRVVRWLLERTFGVAQGRKLPRLATRTFMNWAHRKRLTRSTRRSGPKVLYFTGLFANWYDVQLAQAFVTVLEHNGVAVYVHPGQVESGMQMVAMGAIDRARQMARQNIPILAEAIRQGYDIVATEPSDALCITREYPHLIEDEENSRISSHTFEACQYLWRMHLAGKLELDFQPLNISVGYHQPCHLKALEVGAPGKDLLDLVPGLVVHSLDKGCSGMAGCYGLKKENYRASLRMGWGLISAMRDQRLACGSSECSTCRIQMEQGSDRPTIHPLKILAHAYGRMPEVADLLSARAEPLVTT